MKSHVYKGTLYSLMRQSFNATMGMEVFITYARDIGCTVEGDEITCHNGEQARKLDRKWQEIFCDTRR